MRIISIANQKGGCAKTTTAVNLAAALAESKKKVLLLDLDPQSNASQWFGVNGSEKNAFLLFSSTTPIAELIQPTQIQDISVIAGHQDLASVEKVVANELGVDFLLKRRLKDLNSQDWDYLIIDTPPTLGLLTVNALTSSGEVLIPVTTHIMTLTGVAQLMKKYHEIKEILNPDLEILGFLPSRVDLRTKHSKEILQSLIDRFGNKVLKSIIRENVRLAEAPSFGETILMYDSQSGAANDYRDLAREIIELG
jgi:chromosome partitioning protein